MLRPPAWLSRCTAGPHDGEGRCQAESREDEGGGGHDQALPGEGTRGYAGPGAFSPRPNALRHPESM